MKTLIAALCSFVIPGLGQLFYGKVAWAVLWLALAFCFGPLVNLLSMCHVLFVAAK